MVQLHFDEVYKLIIILELNSDAKFHQSINLSSTFKVYNNNGFLSESEVRYCILYNIGRNQHCYRGLIFQKICSEF